MTFYDPAKQRSEAFESGHAAGVACLSHGARMLWALGYPTQALQRSQQALTLAREVSHPASLAYAHTWAAMLHQLRRERPAVQEQAECAVALSREQGLAQFWAGAMILRGWALADQGQIEPGLAEMSQGMAAWRDTGAELVQPYWLALSAEVHRTGGQPAEGLTALAEALALVDKNGQRYYEAELYRLKADLLLRQARPDAAQAEVSFQQALAIARRQEAKALELRAAMSLARVWQQQDKRAEACELLAPIYGWFTEGFDTADLREAKALLEALS
jgi:predicted ATPase